MIGIAAIATWLTAAAWIVVARRGFQRADYWLVINTGILALWWASLV